MRTGFAIGGAMLLGLSTAAPAQITSPVQTALPDLVVSKITIECDRALVTVRNDGGRLMGVTPIMVRMMALAVGVESSLSVERQLPVTSLAAGATSTLAFDRNAMGGSATFWAAWSATVDITNVVQESNERNNTRDHRVENGDEILCPVVTISDARASEGGTVSFSVALDRPPMANRPVTLQFATATGGNAGNARSGDACGPLSSTNPVDFVAASGRLELTSTTPATIQVRTCADIVAEQDETFTVNLTNLTNAFVIRSRTSAKGTIQNVQPTIRR